MSRSRLHTVLEKQSKKTLLITSVGSIIVLILLIFFGTSLLIKLSTLMPDSQKDQAASTDNATMYIEPPTLNSLFSATSSAEVTLKGSANKGQTVKLFVNNTYTDKVTTDSSGSFTFSSVTLKVGKNSLATKAVNNQNKESDYSNTLQIIYSNKPPQLSVDFPSDNQTFEKDQNHITVRGKTDEDIPVTVNGSQAITDGNGNFFYSLKLNEGDNQITISAKDDAGNKTEIQKKVIYHP